MKLKSVMKRGLVLLGLMLAAVSAGAQVTGISSTTLTINDLEDHSWTYYSAKPDAQYPDQLRSPDPRNVKITYQAGSVNNASAPAISATEGVNTIVYYKTIEKKAWGESEGRWLTGDYAYRAIFNPFQKRPRTNGTTGTNGFWGFDGWEVVSGGEYISEKTDGGTIAADELIHFTGVPAGNEVQAEVVLRARWATATVTTVTGNVTGNPNNAFSGGTYETNFVVVSGNNRTVTGMTRNATVMGCYPDGSGATGARLSTVTGSANDLKIENINLGDGTKDFTANTGWLIVGRGCTGNVRRVLGNNNTHVMFRLESGTYHFIEPMAYYYNNANHATTANACYGRIIFGNDYDRATNDGLTSNDQYADNSNHRKLRVINYVTANGTAVTHGNDDRSEWMDITIKSGYYGYSADYSLYSTTNANNADGFGLGIGGNTDHAGTYTAPDINGAPCTYTDLNAGVNNTTYRWQRIMSFYCGRTRGGGYGGVNRVLVEGGELNSINGGGYRNTGAGFGVCYHFRMKGGWVKGAIYGTASSSQTNATTKQVITGGEINGWVAGACNGTDVDNAAGENLGDTYIYLGGNAQLRSHRRDGVYNNAWGLVGGVEGGNIFASGRGTPATTKEPTRNYCGSSYKTYAVVADNGVVEQGVYGGGYIGVAQNSHIYITGGTTGKVFGGASTPTSTNNTWMTQTTDIRQYGGTVKEGIYGGHYQGTGNAGKIHQDVSVAIYGGQVGAADAAGQRANIHGGGYGAGTSVGGDVHVTLGKCDTTVGATVFGDVYGGSALGSVNDATTDSTVVTLHKGTIHGALYGGGLGDSTSLGAGHSNVRAAVNGKVQVLVTGGSVVCASDDLKGEAGSGSVFGCNNVNGAPASDVRVDIYRTDAPADPGSYAHHAVYGGGNKAAYGRTPVVAIHGCDNSIEYVYGGGNATAVAGTDVTIWGGTIGYAFGGGNGFSETGNHGDNTRPHYNPGANITSNGTHLTIHGGTIREAFGGSNQYGTINSTITVDVAADHETGTGPCNIALGECPTPMAITALYGGGNEAEVKTKSGDWIAPQVNLDCSAKVDTLFGGAKKANHGAPINLVVNGGTYKQIFGGNNLNGTITGNVSVTMHGGTAGQVFGGNNKGGSITGTVTVTIDSNLTTCPGTFEVQDVYGGGNEAEYNHAAGNYPQVNIKHGTVRNNVFGGGLGAAAKVTGSPRVTLGGVNGAVTTPTVVNVFGNVYGGGNEAEVEGTTQVVMFKGLVGKPGESDREKGNIFGGGKGKSSDIDAGMITGNTQVTLKGGTVEHNVYGGGHLGQVTGNTDVQLTQP